MVTNFNPHSHKESDYHLFSAFYGKNDFNPHSHKESDAIRDFMQKLQIISIHTLTKRVTAFRSSAAVLTAKFQSTLSQREWPAPMVIRLFSIAFQSTLSQREWRGLAVRWACGKLISIHTLTKRVTVKTGFEQHIVFHFNPHSHKESDYWEHGFFSYKSISIHTLTKRVTCYTY